MTVLRRCVGALLAIVLLSAGLARPATTTDFSDQWWIAGESGWGASVLQQADVLFVTLFVYGPDGNPTWLSAAAVRKAGAPAGHERFTGDLYQIRGTFHGDPWNPAARVYRNVGILTFDATAADSATLTYTVDGTPVTKSVTRTLWRYESLGGSYLGGWSGDRVACTPASDGGHFEAPVAIEIEHGADNGLTLRVVELATGSELRFSGTYDQSGHLGRISAMATTSSSGMSLEVFEIARTISGFTGRFVGSARSSEGACQIANGRIAGVRRDPVTPTSRGRVMDGRIEGAIVCSDVNRNGRCEAGERQGRSDAAGTFDASIVGDGTAPLVAEVVAGVSRDAQSPGTTVDVSFRMSSPTGAYSDNITPYTTLVRLAGRADLGLAEDIVRNELGVPPKFDLRPATAPAVGSLTHAVGESVASALKATSATLDLSGRDALAEVVAAFPPALTDLPTLRISTRGGVPIDDRDRYVDATFELTNPAASRVPVTLEGQIRGRGHSTWGQPKNPYHVKLADDLAYAAVPDFLGMNKGRHWALLADWFDRSLIRNKLAYSLGSSVVFSEGLKWTPSAQHLEVYLNGDYIGVYLLAELTRIDPDRLALRTMSKDPVANEVDGGFVVEVEERVREELNGPWYLCYREGEINLQHLTPHGVPFCIDRPDEEDITVPQIAYIKQFLDAVELDIYARRSLEKVNPASVADWYLVNELFRNQDAQFYSSVFMWKDTDSAVRPQDRLLNLGPIWDFDRSAGNVNYDDNWLTEGCWVSKNYYHNWVAGALDLPEFAQVVRLRWQEKRAALADFVNSGIDTFARRLRAAQARNFARWPILGTQLVNYYTFETWDEEVAFVKAYLNQRLAWLDQAFESADSFEQLCK